MFECTKLTFCNVSARVGLLQANTTLGDTLTKTNLFAHEYLPKQSLAQETGWLRSRLLNTSCQTKLTPQHVRTTFTSVLCFSTNIVYIE